MKNEKLFCWIWFFSPAHKIRHSEKPEFSHLWRFFCHQSTDKKISWKPSIFYFYTLYIHYICNTVYSKCKLWHSVLTQTQSRNIEHINVKNSILNSFTGLLNNEKRKLGNEMEFVYQRLFTSANCFVLEQYHLIFWKGAKYRYWNIDNQNAIFMQNYCSIGYDTANLKIKPSVTSLFK